MNGSTLRLRLVAATVALLAVLVGVGLRVRELDAGSLQSQHAAVVLRGRTELVRLERPPGSEVVAEVCSVALANPSAIPAPLAAVTFAIVDLADDRAVFERRVDPASVRRGAGYGCVRLAEAAAGRGSDRLALVARADAPVESLIVGRFVTRRPLTPADFALVAALLGLAVALLALVVRSPMAAEAPEPGPGSGGFALALLLVGLLAFVGVSELPIRGTLGGLARGGLLVLVQLGLVLVALPRASRAALGFVRGTRPWLAIGLAPLVALGIRALGQLAVRLLPASVPSAVSRLAIPSAGRVHAETILDPRSGMLAIAAVAIVAPVVEELFFRGVVYGSLERWKGRNVAACGAAFAFVLAHVPQTLGDPGALVSITLLSVTATALRVRSQSVLAPAATHLVHNALLVAVGLAFSR